MTLSSEFEGLIQALANDLLDPERIKTAIKESFTDLIVNGFSVDLEVDSPQGEKLIRSAQGLIIEEIQDAIRLAAAFGRRKHEVLLKLKKLLESFGIKHSCTTVLDILLTLLTCSECYKLFKLQKGDRLDVVF